MDGWTIVNHLMWVINFLPVVAYKAPYHLLISSSIYIFMVDENSSLCIIRISARGYVEMSSVVVLVSMSVSETYL